MNDRKLKVYLDTAVLSHLWQLDAPVQMQQTLELWQRFKEDIFDIYLSDLTIDEVNECSDEKKKSYLNI